MNDFMEHMQEYWKAYVAVCACLLPVALIFRRRFFGVLFWVIETLVYFAVTHAVLLGVLFLAAWFKENTQMYWMEKVRPDWHMPLIKLWEYEEYKPKWLIFLEGGLFLLIVFVMYRYKPMKVQRITPKREHLSKGQAPPRSRGGGTRKRGKRRR